MTTHPSSPQNGSAGGGSPPDDNSRTAGLLAQIAALRELVAEGRDIFPPHWDISPRWERHESRLDEIERLMGSGSPEDCERVDALHAGFLLHMKADMASTMNEPIKRLARLMDQGANWQPENKFHLPLDAFDCVEDVLFPLEGEPGS